MTKPLPRAATLLGLAGWLPQAACLLLAAMPGPYFGVAQTAGGLYAALILSFLGGLWWMAALMSGARGAGPYVLAVVPSLAGWSSLLPWALGSTTMAGPLVALGLMLIASPLADAALARRLAFPQGWLRLRITMAAGLGLLTLALSAL